MENKAKGRSFLPILLVFIALTLFFSAARGLLAGWAFDYKVLLAGNGILFLVTSISFYLYLKSLQNNNIQAFLRTVYGGLLVKFCVCLVAVFLYAYLARPHVNRNGVFGCFVLYILYTFLEVRILMQRIRKVSNHA
jgi:hypothetical protein